MKVELQFYEIEFKFQNDEWNSLATTNGSALSKIARQQVSGKLRYAFSVHILLLITISKLTNDVDYWMIT